MLWTNFLNFVPWDTKHSTANYKSRSRGQTMMNPRQKTSNFGRNSEQQQGYISEKQQWKERTSMSALALGRAPMAKVRAVGRQRDGTLKHVPVRCAHDPPPGGSPAPDADRLFDALIDLDVHSCISRIFFPKAALTSQRRPVARGSETHRAETEQVTWPLLRAGVAAARRYLISGAPGERRREKRRS